MAVADLEELVAGPTEDDEDGLHHLYCDCRPDKALCGSDLDDEEPDSDPSGDDQECVVCYAMAWALCPYCGAP